MKVSRKKITFIASCMIVIGIIFGVVGFSAGAELSISNTKDGIKVIKKEDRINEEFSLPSFKNMKVDFKDADIEIIPSNEYKLEIERLKWTEVKHEVVNDTLVLTGEHQKSDSIFLMNLSFKNIPKPFIKIYVPKDAKFSDISLVNKFGDIRLVEMAVDKMDINANDGDIEIKDFQSNELTIENGFGDITGSNVKTAKLQVEMNDGDAVFKELEAASADVNNKFGDITFRELTSQGLTMKSNDGDIEIQGKLLGNSVIHSSFGDIDLKLSNKESELSYSIRNQFGDISINDNHFEAKATNKANTENKLDIVSNDGDVQVDF
ncbi:DUF4097 family beta strand repeat-containing protein [Cytobacillus massiliigabonensis]|uniref:DUF4097 family beta strand repeat-containing protein n=1 Tax=Cytobacillus massiliigabonensis TaxID=1871011 RepID=UPI000C8537F4|nr:DUF4097 family beta strand repeat-containing protein [Cytobacillus massiliigabonensis]